MQQCPTCGSMNPDDAEVCADCGMELPSKNASTGTPAPTPEATAPGAAPSPAPFDFAPEAASTGTGATPEATAPAATPAPASDPFAGGEWNFDLNKGAEPATGGQATEIPTDATTPEAAAPPLDVPAPTPMPMESAPTAVIEPTPAPLTPTPAATTGSAKLVLKRGGAPTGDVFSIGSSATVGRFDPESGPVDVDLAQLPESVYISRHHAEINLRDGQWQVKDLGSRNGTFVKNASGFSRVTGETPVQNGDEVAFGNARFEFQAS